MTDYPAGRDDDPAETPVDVPADGASLRLAGAVHDINQMLAVILGRAELLLQREEAGTIREDIEAMALAAGDAAVILKRLQQGASVRSLTGGDQVVNLRDSVREVSLLIRPKESGRWAKPDEETTGPAWILVEDVPGDLFVPLPGQVVREVLSNLLINALEVLPGGGRIVIDALADLDRVHLAVADDGPGLDKAAAQRIFEPGFTSHEGKFRGIGLAGSRQLLKCFDGRLTLAGNSVGGARFELDLPRVPGNAGAGPDVFAPPTARGSIPADFPVLVVDDEPGVRDMLQDVLGEMGCRVSTFPEAKAALGSFVPGSFCLAVIDQTLPGMSGKDLAASMRQKDPDLVVVLTTGWDRSGVLEDADPAHVDMTAAKPMKWNRIQEILVEGAALFAARNNRESG